MDVIRNVAEIEQFGRLQFSVEEVATIVGVSAMDIYESEPLQTAYLRGRLKAQAEVRESIVLLATQGNAQSQKQFLDLARESEPELYADDPETAPDPEPQPEQEG